MNIGLINGKEDVILHHCILDDLDFCFLTETWIKDEDFDSVNRLRKAGYCFRNIPREDKQGGGTGLILRDRYNPSLVNKGRHVTFELSLWQIKVGKKTMNILIVYRPPYSRGNPYTGFKFVERSGDFLGDILNNTNKIMGDFNFHVDDVKDSENLVFQDLQQSFGLIQHVGCPTHQSGHALDLILTK